MQLLKLHASIYTINRTLYMHCEFRIRLGSARFSLYIIQDTQVRLSTVITRIHLQRELRACPPHRTTPEYLPKNYFCENFPPNVTASGIKRIRIHACILGPGPRSPPPVTARVQSRCRKLNVRSRRDIMHRSF